MSGKHPWWHFGFHFWTYSHDEVARELMRQQQDGMSRWIMGTFECRELRTCRHCGRHEHRDIYGGNYIPWGWQLRSYS